MNVRRSWLSLLVLQSALFFLLLGTTVRLIVPKNENKDLHRNEGVQYPRIQLEPTEDYPMTRNLLGVLQEWPPDDPDDQPRLFNEVLQHFDWNVPAQRTAARAYRDKELPFKIVNAPDIVNAGVKWTDNFLIGQFDQSSPRIQYVVEQSQSNHFLYYKPPARGNKMHRNDFSYRPPTKKMKMSYARFAELARAADQNKLGADAMHHYFMTGTRPREGVSAAQNHDYARFIENDLNIFSIANGSTFFVSDTAGNRGIQCRFGMRGVIAEAHYDVGRNFIAMLRGSKRYILTPPSSCTMLDLIKDRAHPSFRHSRIDWSDLGAAAKANFTSVQSVQTVLKQGELLYMPSCWFHYIVSLDFSIQCNSRSGRPPPHVRHAEDHITKCIGTFPLAE